LEKFGGESTSNGSQRNSGQQAHARAPHIHKGPLRIEGGRPEIVAMRAAAPFPKLEIIMIENKKFHPALDCAKCRRLCYHAYSHDKVMGEDEDKVTVHIYECIHCNTQRPYGRE